MGSVFDLLDVQRVEVLRGPQGTLFGKNAVGGAIQVITAPPEHQFDAAIEGLYGSFNRTNLRGFVNLPMSDNIATRLSFSYKRADAYGTRRDFATGDNLGRDMGNENNLTLRGMVDYQPTSALDVMLSADYTRVREECRPWLSLTPHVAGRSRSVERLGRRSGGNTLGRPVHQQESVCHLRHRSQPSDLDAGGLAAPSHGRGAI